MATMQEAEHLRRTAAALDQKAADLVGVSQRLARQVAGMVYAGPAADEFRGAMAGKQQQLAKAAADLQAVAAAMVRSATEIEARVGGWGAP